MSSSFGGIQSALTGLMASRKALEVVGQNITNSATAGYTRQSANLQAIGATGQVSTQGVADNVGSGVQVLSVGRTSDDLLNARVNSTAADSAMAAGRSTVYTSLENLTSEPTDTGLAGQLDTMWNAWGDLSNAASVTTTSSSATTAANIRPVVLADTQTVVNAIASGYQSVSDQWDAQLKQAQTNVTSVNSTATSLAALNAKIKVTVASGGDANSLLDQRDQMVTALSTLTGATAQVNDDGTANVYLGGQSLVAGSKAYGLAVDTSPTAPTSMSDLGYTIDPATGATSSAKTLNVVFTDGQQGTAGISSGALGANLEALNSTLPRAGAQYDNVASALASTVNGYTAATYDDPSDPSTQNGGGVDGNGQPGVALFTTSDGSATFTARNLQVNTVVAQDTSGLKLTAASYGRGSADGSLADALSRQGTATSGPNAAWKNYVSDLGTRSAAATVTANLAATAATTAVSDQQSVSGVSLDEETTNLLTMQRTYQGAAKVLSAMDSMLGVLMDMVS